MPAISVVIPVFNGEITIKETIESVINQTFSDFEIIVINDGSQDTTLEILSTIQDPRLKVFSYPNQGQGASRNRGIHHASGQYIAFLDADDIWTPDKLERQFKALEIHSHAAVAYSWTDSIDESGHFHSKGPRPEFEGDVFPQLLLTNFLVNGSNPLIRYQALIEVGGFDEKLPPAEDWDMWLKLANHYHFVVVNSPQVLYRQSSLSASSNVLKMEKASLKVLKNAFNYRHNSLKNISNTASGNLYKYLTWKTLEGIPARKNSLIAARFLFYAIRYDASLLQTRTFIKALLKIIMTGFFPTKINQTLLNRLGKFSDITTILGYIQIEPPAMKELN